MDNLAITYQHIADILSFETSNTELQKTLLAPDFNWESIVKEGSKHFILPTIYCRLEHKKLLHLLPDDLVGYLEYITNENRKRNDIVIAQIEEISILLNAHQITHVFLKGAALLVLGCFNDKAERMLGDIDILVDPNRVNEAYNLLCDNGYVPSDQTLGNDFFEHKHLPRLKTDVTPTRIAAVEMHRKLFVSFKAKELANNLIFAEKQLQHNVSIPSLKHLLMHNILNFQINDQGALYNSISFRSSYDTIVLLKGYFGPKNWYKKRVYRKYFSYTGLFFNDIKLKTNVKSNIFTYFYLFKLKHIKFYKRWNKLLGFTRVAPILFNRMWFFMSNSAYRKAIIKDRNRIFAHFKSILSNF